MALTPAETQRLSDLNAKRDGRMVNGSPRKGYAKNVLALNQEIRALETKAKTVDTPAAPA